MCVWEHQSTGRTTRVPAPSSAVPLGSEAWGFPEGSLVSKAGQVHPQGLSGHRLGGVCHPWRDAPCAAPRPHRAGEGRRWWGCWRRALEQSGQLAPRSLVLVLEETPAARLAPRPGAGPEGARDPQKSARLAGWAPGPSEGGNVEREGGVGGAQGPGGCAGREGGGKLMET